MILALSSPVLDLYTAWPVWPRPTLGPQVVCLVGVPHGHTPRLRLLATLALRFPTGISYLNKTPCLESRASQGIWGLLGAKAGEALSMGLSIGAALEEQYGKANGNSRVLRNSYALRDFDCPLFSAPLTGALPSSSGFLHGMYTLTSATTAWQPLSTLSHSPHLHEHVWQIPLLFGQHLKCFPSTIIHSVSCVIPTRAL